MEKNYLDKHPDVIEAGRRYCRAMYEKVRKEQLLREKSVKTKRIAKQTATKTEVQHRKVEK